jgi:hypothetical protein
LKVRNHGLFVFLIFIFFSLFTFQIDTDLVFDDGTANSNDYGSHADHRKSSSSVRDHSNTSRLFQNIRSHPGPSNSDHQIVAPVESPLEDPEEVKPDISEDSDSSFFGTLSELGKHARRQWSLSLFGEEQDSEHTTSSSATEGKGLFGFSSGNLLGDWFGGFDGSNSRSDKVTSATNPTSETESGELVQSTTSHDLIYRNRRSLTSDNFTDEANVDGLEGTDEESTTEQLDTEENGKSDVAVAAARRPGQLEHHISDDEDYFSEAASGSGMDGRTVPPTSAVPPTDRQPSEYCARFYKV